MAKNSNPYSKVENFDVANVCKKIATAALDKAGAALASIPGVSTGPMGLTPDHVKATQQFKDATAEWENAFNNLRAINTVINSRFKKEYAAQRRDDMAKRIAGLSNK